MRTLVFKLRDGGRSVIGQSLVAAVCILAVVGFARATPIGNPIVDLGPGDNATNVLQIYSSTPVPSTGFIVSFSYYGESDTEGTGGGSFDAYILRPTVNANEYTVLYDSGPITSVLGAQSIPIITPVAVQAGDVIADFGNGISFVEGGTDAQYIFYPGTQPPSAGNTFTASTVQSMYHRTYSFAADFVPEPGTLSLICFGVPLLRRRTRRP